MLNIENLHYAYRGRPVLNGVNLHIERGTLLTLLGRNGANPPCSTASQACSSRSRGKCC